MNTAARVAQADAPLLRRDLRADGVLTLTLSRPQARNALSIAMLDALSAAFADIAADRSVRVVVLAAEGPAFSSGHDLKEITAARAGADGGRAFFEDTLTRCAKMMQQVVALPQPVIAAVEGIASAAGCQLVATCDLAIAGDKAQFCTPGVNIGLFCSTPMVALSRNLSRKHAMEMLLSGDMFDAADAERFGLVNRVAPAGGALDAALALAGKIASKSTMTVKIGKRAFYEQAEMRLGEAYDYASRVMVENLLARDADEGISAFVQKRAPSWEDR
ncbi:MAG: enoyl-CoA hydratase [Methylobacteriaceae bacterium]|nr:enoyl-CoA hydratase [Methylobacteriaceae bacterium]MCC0001701.1 enoyl-CoA hydratase [Methylobacteriaceae bacterium]MCO5088539.1 enoyl-CoA hydratase [Methylobacteriaceae bacterium]